MRRVRASTRNASGCAIALTLLSSSCGQIKRDDPTSVEVKPSEFNIDELSAVAASEKSRAAYVAEADALALSAAHTKEENASQLYLRAALLRFDAYIAFGKKVDVLESLELLSHHLGSNSDDCDAHLLSIKLETAIGKEPRALYRDLFLMRERVTDPGCRKRLDHALIGLTAFKPNPSELMELRDNMRKLREQQLASHQETDAVQVAGATDSQHVVMPDVLKASLDAPTEITKIEPFAAERTARVVVHVTHPTRFQVGTLAASDGQGPRLFVDIDHAAFKSFKTLEAQGILKTIRLGKHKTGARVVLDLSREVYHRVFYLPEPFRLVIDLSLDAPDKDAHLRKIRRVVLDPGHGGHDPGAVGTNGLQEKDVALDIAHRAAPLLAREVGVSTLLTRDIDVYVPLDERAARANAFHADLFVSIHLNSNADHSSRGVMTFVLDASRDAAASKVAARENSSSEAAAVELANSLSRIDSLARREASELFASLLQRAAGASLRQRYDDVLDSGVRRAGFYVLAGASMPAVLFEGSFLSNPTEADRLNSEDYRQRLADAIVNAVRAYREGM